MNKKFLIYRQLLFWLLAIGYVLVYFHRQCTAVLATDLMKDLRVDGAIMGLFGALYFYPYAVLQIPAGLLADSWGPRKTITVFFGIACIGAVLLGVSIDTDMALAGRLLVGIGTAMLFVPALKVLSRWFRPQEFATMTGFLIAMGGLGTMISTAPLAFASARMGWRNSFFLVAGFTLFLALAIWMLVRDDPRDRGWQSVIAMENRPASAAALKAGLLTVLREKHFWFLGGWFFFTMAIFFSFGGLWGGPFLIDVYGLDKQKAGAILSLLAIGMIVCSPLLSIISNRILKSRKKPIIACSVLSCAIMALISFDAGGLSVGVLSVLCFVLGVSSSAIVVIAFTANKELFPVSLAGSATGLINLFPFAGGAVFQQIMGYILQSYGRDGSAFTLAGYEAAFLALFFCSVLALIFSLCIKETMPDPGAV